MAWHIEIIAHPEYAWFEARASAHLVGVTLSVAVVGDVPAEDEPLMSRALGWFRPWHWRFAGWSVRGPGIGAAVAEVIPVADGWRDVDEMREPIVRAVDEGRVGLLTGPFTERLRWRGPEHEAEIDGERHVQPLWGWYAQLAQEPAPIPHLLQLAWCFQTTAPLVKGQTFVIVPDLTLVSAGGDRVPLGAAAPASSTTRPADPAPATRGAETRPVTGPTTAATSPVGATPPTPVQAATAATPPLTAPETWEFPNPVRIEGRDVRVRYRCRPAICSGERNSDFLWSAARPSSEDWVTPLEELLADAMRLAPLLLAYARQANWDWPARPGSAARGLFAALVQSLRQTANTGVRLDGLSADPLASFAGPDHASLAGLVLGPLEGNQDVVARLAAYERYRRPDEWLERIGPELQSVAIADLADVLNGQGGVRVTPDEVLATVHQLEAALEEPATAGRVIRTQWRDALESELPMTALPSERLADVLRVFDAAELGNPAVPGAVTAVRRLRFDRLGPRPTARPAVAAAPPGLDVNVLAFFVEQRRAIPGVSLFHVWRIVVARDVLALWTELTRHGFDGTILWNLYQTLALGLDLNRVLHPLQGGNATDGLDFAQFARARFEAFEARYFPPKGQTRVRRRVTETAEPIEVEVLQPEATSDNDNGDGTDPSQVRERAGFGLALRASGAAVETVGYYAGWTCPNVAYAYPGKRAGASPGSRPAPTTVGAGALPASRPADAVTRPTTRPTTDRTKGLERLFDAPVLVTSRPTYRDDVLRGHLSYDGQPMAARSPFADAQLVALQDARPPASGASAVTDPLAEPAFAYELRQPPPAPAHGLMTPHFGMTVERAAFARMNSGIVPTQWSTWPAAGDGRRGHPACLRPDLQDPPRFDSDKYPRTTPPTAPSLAVGIPPNAAGGAGATPAEVDSAPGLLQPPDARIRYLARELASTGVAPGGVGWTHFLDAKQQPKFDLTGDWVLVVPGVRTAGRGGWNSGGGAAAGRIRLTLEHATGQPITVDLLFDRGPGGIKWLAATVGELREELGWGGRRSRVWSIWLRRERGALQVAVQPGPGVDFARPPEAGLWRVVANPLGDLRGFAFRVTAGDPADGAGTVAWAHQSPQLRRGGDEAAHVPEHDVPLVLLHDGADRQRLRIQPPACDWRIYVRWRAGVEHPRAWPELVRHLVAAQVDHVDPSVRAAGTREGSRRVVESGAKAQRFPLADPAVTRVRVEWLPVRSETPRRAAVFVRDIAPVDVEVRRVVGAADPDARPVWRGDTLELEVGPGEIWELRLYPAVDEKEYDAGRMDPVVRGVARDAPSSLRLFAPFRLQVESTPTLERFAGRAESRPAADDLPDHTAREAFVYSMIRLTADPGARRFDVSLATEPGSADQAVADEVSAFVEYLSDVRLVRQQWRSVGRPLPAAFPWTAVTRAMDRPEIRYWETTTFDHRDGFDQVESRHEIAPSQLAGGAHLLEIPLEQGSEYMRVGITALARYLPVEPRMFVIGQRRAIPAAAVPAVERWQRVVLPASASTSLTPPSIRSFVPILWPRRPDKDEPSDPPQDAPPSLVLVLHDAPEVQGKFAEEIVGDVEVVPHPAGPGGTPPTFDQQGADPIHNPPPAGPDKVLIFAGGDVVGPLGHTFDRDDDFPLFSGTSYVLDFPRSVLRFMVDRARNPGQPITAPAYMAKVAFRRRLDPEAVDGPAAGVVVRQWDGGRKLTIDFPDKPPVPFHDYAIDIRGVGGPTRGQVIAQPVFVFATPELGPPRPAAQARWAVDWVDARPHPAWADAKSRDVRITLARAANRPFTDAYGTPAGEEKPASYYRATVCVRTSGGAWRGIDGAAWFADLTSGPVRLTSLVLELPDKWLSARTTVDVRPLVQSDATAAQWVSFAPFAGAVARFAWDAKSAGRLPKMRRLEGQGPSLALEVLDTDFAAWLEQEHAVGQGDFADVFLAWRHVHDVHGVGNQPRPLGLFAPTRIHNAFCLTRLQPSASQDRGTVASGDVVSVQRLRVMRARPLRPQPPAEEPFASMSEEEMINLLFPPDDPEQRVAVDARGLISLISEPVTCEVIS